MDACVCVDWLPLRDREKFGVMQSSINCQEQS